MPLSFGWFIWRCGRVISIPSDLDVCMAQCFIFHVFLSKLLESDEGHLPSYLRDHLYFIFSFIFKKLKGTLINFSVSRPGSMSKPMRASENKKMKP